MWRPESGRGSGGKEVSDVDERDPNEPQTSGPWPGQRAGMPAPPGWSYPTPGPEQQIRGRRRAPTILAAALALLLLITSFSVGALLTGFWSNNPGPRAWGRNPNGAEVTGTTAGVVDINTFQGVTGSAQQPLGAGTGMVLTSNGQVLTNNHVVDGATSIKVTVPQTDTTYSGSVVGVDPNDDVALVQLQGASNLPTITVGDSSSVSVGDHVTAVGNALGRGGTPTITSGSITGLSRSITANDPNGESEHLDGLVQTDATIRPGDSGGALLNESGQVVAMITAGSGGRQASLGRPANVAFAIPVNTALGIVNDIRGQRTTGGILLGERGFLGVEVAQQPFTNLAGAQVSGVIPNSPAARIGIVGGSVIRSVDGHDVASANDLGPILQSHVPGDRVSVEWVDPTGATQTGTAQLISGPAV